MFAHFPMGVFVVMPRRGRAAARFQAWAGRGVCRRHASADARFDYSRRHPALPRAFGQTWREFGPPYYPLALPIFATNIAKLKEFLPRC
jgi:hypothetical protein